ncbi:MAG: DUF1801 domain-containing protein [Bacteroidota bacterium]
MSVRDFIESQEKERRDLMRYLHHLFSEEMGLVSKIRYRVPFYYNRSWICYLNPIKTGGIELVFLRGNELSNVQGILDHRGRKQVSGIMLEKLADIPQEAIREIMHEAIILDETVKYASKRKGK